MTQRTAEEVEVSERRRRVAERYVQGYKQADIAIALCISQPTVSRDLQEIREEWKQDRQRDIDAYVTEQLEKLDRVEREAWTAWERSKGPREETEVSLGEPETDAEGKPKKQRAKSRKKTSTTAGDPRFLLIVDRCIERRCKLIPGMEAPTVIAGAIGITEAVVVRREDATSLLSHLSGPGGVSRFAGDN